MKGFLMVETLKWRKQECGASFSLCGRWPSCIFETSGLRKSYSAQLAREQKKACLWKQKKKAYHSMHLLFLKHVGVDWKVVYKAQACSRLLGVKCYLNLNESEEPWQQGNQNLHAYWINKPPSISALNEKLLPVALTLFLSYLSCRKLAVHVKQVLHYGGVKLLHLTAQCGTHLLRRKLIFL